jgi:hypothetical protein
MPPSLVGLGLPKCKSEWTHGTSMPPSNHAGLPKWILKKIREEPEGREAIIFSHEALEEWGYIANPANSYLMK